MGGKLKRWRTAVRRWKRAGRPIRSDREMAIIYWFRCRPCEHFQQTRRGGKCDLCSCRLNLGKRARLNKLRMATEGCPADPPRWLASN